MALALALLIPFIAFICANAALAAAPQTTKFGPYFLTQQQIGPGLFRFQISLSQPPAGDPWLSSSSMLTDPSSWKFPPKDEVDTQSRVFLDGVNSSSPVLSIFETVETLSQGLTGGDKKTDAEVFSIKPFAPDGKLAGLTFFGERYTHLVGLGADFRFGAVNINYDGQVFMPGGPFGSIVQVGRRSHYSSGFQAPICYALGLGHQNGAIFINESRPLMWDFSNKPWFVGPAGSLGPSESIDFFVLTGPDLPSLRRTLMTILGRPPVPPISVFKPWIRAEPTQTHSATSELFNSISSIYKNMGPLTVFLDSFPGQPPLQEATQAGVNLLVPETPYLPIDSPSYGDMDKRNFLVKSEGPQGQSLNLKYRDKISALIDYTNPAAASYFNSLERTDLLKTGARLFYLFGGQPEVYSPTAWYQGGGESESHSHYAWSGRFSLKWMEAIQKSLNNLMAPSRLFLLAQAGQAGLGRYGAGLIASEPNAFFAPNSGQARSHLFMSGVDYVSTDVSPFLDQFPLERNNRLYEAWLANSALVNIPLFIPQGLLDQPWAKMNLATKAKLEPYYYSLAFEAYLKGNPIVSPLFYQFQDDQMARKQAVVAMVGPFLLVAAGLNVGDETIDFHLPQGRWYDLYNAELIEQKEGGQYKIPCKFSGLQAAPLLLRAGAIFPSIYDLDDPQKRILIRAFPAQEPSSFDWYEDNGQNYNYLRGELALTKLTLVPKGEKNLTLTIQARKGTVSSLSNVRSYLVEFVGLDNVAVALLDGQQYSRLASAEQLTALDAGYFSNGTGRLLFKTPPLDLTKDHVIEIR